jgi:hypothetical protein
MYVNHKSSINKIGIKRIGLNMYNKNDVLLTNEFWEFLQMNFFDWDQVWKKSIENKYEIFHWTPKLHKCRILFGNLE